MKVRSRSVFATIARPREIASFACSACAGVGPTPKVFPIRMVAMPQAAMAQFGSRSSTSRNVFSPSCHQNECSSATARSKLGCAALAHELAKEILPSCSGALSADWPEAAPASERAASAAMIECGFFMPVQSIVLLPYRQGKSGKPDRRLAKSAETRQTGAPFNARSEVHLGSPDSRDSLPDAGDPAEEEKGEEGLGRDGEAGEEGEKAEREEGRRGRPEIPLAAQSSDTPSSLAIAIITGPSSRYRPTNSCGVVGFSIRPKVS